MGCPGGGDWCYASSGPASAGGGRASSEAKNVAAALAGLGSAGGIPKSSQVMGGVKKSYGIGSWKK